MNAGDLRDMNSPVGSVWYQAQSDFLLVSVGLRIKLDGQGHMVAQTRPGVGLANFNSL